LPNWLKKSLLVILGSFLEHLEQYIEFWKEQEKFFEAELNAEDLIYKFARERKNFYSHEVVEMFESVMDKKKIIETLEELVKKEKIKYVTLFEMEVVE